MSEPENFDKSFGGDQPGPDHNVRDGDHAKPEGLKNDGFQTDSGSDMIKTRESVQSKEFCPNA